MTKTQELETPQSEQDVSQEKLWQYCWIAIQKFIEKYRKAGMHEVVKKQRRHHERKEQ